MSNNEQTWPTDQAEAEAIMTTMTERENKAIEEGIN